MPQYKLTYFNLQALGEPIRFLLAYGGLDFEDNRITFDQWPNLKPQTPLGQLPILEVDGKTLYQSNAIARFLAQKLNILGSNDVESFGVDVTLENISDLRQVLAKWSSESDPAKKAATKDETFEKVAFYLGKFESTVKENGGHFVSGKLTAADIVFAGIHNFLNHLAGKNIIADYPNLKNLVDKVVNLPGIKSYIAKRPQTDF